MKKAKKQGFTLVEIMIVVAIIGLLAAIGIPSFQKARANSIKKSMENNARMVTAAWDQIALEDAMADSETPDQNDAVEYIKGGWDALNVGAEDATYPTVTLAAIANMSVEEIADDMYPGVYNTL